MNFELMHPSDEIVHMMQRIYRFGMTTTSGGNISILDNKGDIWITPAGVDKGSLTRGDIIRVRPDGKAVGPHKPSSELPFHQAIYQSRKDFKAVLHAHPSALVAFSIARKIPDTRIIPQAYYICGTAGYAPYAVPGSMELGRNISRVFEKGFDTVLLENHGVVTGGDSLSRAFQRFETLDFCARIAVKAGIIGRVKTLTEDQIRITQKDSLILPEFSPDTHSSEEKELRDKICEMVKRAYGQQLMISTEGTVSARLDKDSFIITPFGVDRRYIQSSDIVVISHGKREIGKMPSRSVTLHIRIYEDHPEINAVVIAQPPNSLAFAVSDRTFDTRSIPESYIVLRNIPKLPFGVTSSDEAAVSKSFSKKSPVVLIENDCIITTGASLLQAYDRLEVAEFSARSLIYAESVGELKPISGKEIEEIENAYPE